MIWFALNLRLVSFLYMLEVLGWPNSSFGFYIPFYKLLAQPNTSQTPPAAFFLLQLQPMYSNENFKDNHGESIAYIPSPCSQAAVSFLDVQGGYKLIVDQ